MRRLLALAAALAFSAISYSTPAQSADLAEVQQALAELGHNPGPADGQYGRRTDQALRDLFRRASVAFDGTLDDRRAEFVLDYRDFMRRDTDLLVGLVTRQVDPSSLTHTQVCDTLRVLPLRPTFEEASARGLECDLSVDLDLDLPRRYLGLDELEDYAARYAVGVPDSNLEDVPPVYPDLGAARVAFDAYNAALTPVLQQVSNGPDFAFCRDWLPTVRHVMPDPSKNLDGTGSWREETLRDAQVYCQDRLHLLFLVGVGTHPGAAEAVSEFQAALAAQVTLRVGILAQSPELVRRAYLTFHRYLSAIRPDGSPAFDSMRGCYAADYVSWAAMFSDAFLFQWGRVAEVDWDLSVNGGGTVRDMFEYALRVVESPNDVNEYAGVHRFDECYDAEGNLQQRLREDPLQFYSTYLAAHDPERLKSLVGQRRNQYDFSRGGGPNYEAANLMALVGLPRGVDPADYVADRHAGRYRMTWQLYNEDLGHYEITATDTLTLAAGRGGIDLGRLPDPSMGPSDVLRRGLQVTYTPSGKARAEGLLNYWCCDSPAEPVVLRGDLDGGLLSDGASAGGRRYRVVLQRLPD